MPTGVSKSSSKSASKRKETQVTFEFYAPLAAHVALAGNFNGWNPEGTPLVKEKDGKWRTSLILPSGRYEYRFWVDGDWQNDQNPVECVPNPYGTWNCVLQIA